VIDSHCHLDHCEAPDGEVVERAVAAGVRRLATVGIDDASIERALAAAYAHEEVFAIVGRHPHEAEGLDDAGIEAIERAATTSATSRRARISDARSRRRSTLRGVWSCPS